MKFAGRVLPLVLLAGFVLPNAIAHDLPGNKPHSHGGQMLAMQDERTALNLNSHEAALVRTEMRAMLNGIAQLIDATNRNDMKAAAAAAKPMGLMANRDVMMSLAPKMPKEFKALGSAMHQSFDQIAMDAESLGDAKHTMNQLAEAMQRCVACHAAYRIGSEALPPVASK